jgi:hypothetical protein
MNYIFISIPRTASGSMSKILGMGNHKKAESHRAEYSISAEWDKVFKFAFVRHPYDRFMSAYYHLGNSRKNLDINAYLANHPNTNELLNQTIYDTQTHFIYDQNNKLLIDFVGRFEYLERDWRSVQKKLGIKDKLPHNNAVTRKKDKLTRKSKDILYKMYEKDFWNLGYER